MARPAPIRLAVLGAGRIGQVQARAIAANPGARLVAVADALPEAAAHGAAVAGVEAIAADPRVDAVAICTLTDTHADLIERFARAGKAVFCEKPVDPDAGRVRACLEVVRACGVPLMVGCNRRFDPHFRALKAAIDAGRIGRIEQVAITSRDPAPLPAEYVARSGGLFRDMTIHDVDMARFLLGEAVVSGHAVASALVDPGLRASGEVDTATVVMVAESGTQVVISNARRAVYGHDQRIEVAGSKGMVAAENQRAADIVIADAQGCHAPPLLDVFMTRCTAADAAEIAAFLEAVATGAPVSPGGEDGLAALVLAEAARASLASGGPVAVRA
jgi:myo-inositol 2-dehydrogenase/D-chiro-inositol 1-dehydrogenase